MSKGLNIPQKGALDFLSLGALVNRLDPGIVPFRKATRMRHPRQRRRVQLRRQPVGLLPHEHRHRHGARGISHRRPDCRARPGDGRETVLQEVQARRRARPEPRDGLQRPGPRRARPGGVLQPLQRGGRDAQARRLQLEGDFRRGRALVPQRRHLRRAVRDHRAS